MESLHSFMKNPACLLPEHHECGPPIGKGCQRLVYYDHGYHLLFATVATVRSTSNSIMVVYMPKQVVFFRFYEYSNFFTSTLKT